MHRERSPKPHQGKVIGNGEFTPIWQEPWLSLSKPVRPMEQASVDLTVVNLLLPDSLEWDIAMIKTILSEHEKDILLLKPSKKGAMNRWAWLPTQTCVYSSKFGYYEAVKEDLADPLILPSTNGFNWKSNI